jgi:hypothetical protein
VFRFSVCTKFLTGLKTDGPSTTICGERQFAAGFQ